MFYSAYTPPTVEEIQVEVTDVMLASEIGPDNDPNAGTPVPIV